MSRNLLTPIVVSALLLTAACIGNGGDDADSAAGARPTDPTAVETSTTTSTPTSSSTTAGAGATTTSQPTPSGGTAGGGASAVTGPQTAEPGTYTYDVTGKARTTLGDRPLPPEASTVAGAPDGVSQSFRRDSEQGSTAQVLRFDADGVKLVRQTASGPTGSFELEPEEPALVVPYPATAGRTWTHDMKSKDGKTTVHSTSTVLRAEKVTVGGEAVDAVVIQTTTKTIGEFTVTADSTTWWSLKHSIAVRTDTKARGSYTGMEFETDTSERLRSLDPK